MRRPSRSPIAMLAVAVILGSASTLTSCGADGERTALAVRDTSWNEAGELVLGFECAELDTVDVEPGAGEGGIPLVTVYGTPKVGRCTTEIAVVVPPGTNQLDDATTGMVVDLPPRP